MSAAGKGGSGAPRGGNDGRDKTIAHAVGVLTASSIAWSVYKSFWGRDKKEAKVTPSKHRPTSDKPYLILKGDTLWEISRRHGTTVSEVQRANGLEDPNFIVAGDYLSLP